jgi:hypothetical protein
MVATEEIHEQEGWQENSALYRVLADTDTPLPMNRVTLGQHNAQVIDELRAMARSMADPDLGPIIAQGYGGRPTIAHFVLWEGWVAPKVDMVHTIGSPVRLKDSPSSVRARVGFGVIGSHRLVTLRPQGGDVAFTHAMVPSIAPPTPARNTFFDAVIQLHQAAIQLRPVPTF